MTGFSNMISGLHLADFFRAALFIIGGFFLGKVASISLEKTLKKRVSPHQSMLLRRIVFYLIFILFFASAIQDLGFQMSALLGATGILTIALGIASQTSMSNIISGIFIIGEKPFEIGDSIQVNQFTGEVLAIDFLSVKIRTSDNTMVRIPNETLIKSAITNLSYFPIRRIDLPISISYKENLEQVKKILLAAAKDNPLCLDEPVPSLSVDALGDSSVRVQLSVWAKRGDEKELKNSIQADMKQALAKNNIDLSLSAQVRIINE